MDIDLLSKMVKELILDNDEVTLPGVGTFVAEIVPSSFSDKGYTINPPYRKLSFRQRQSDDTLLKDFYMASNNLARESAEKILEDFFDEMDDVLRQKKVIIFPGLGRLRATKENNFFFVADEDLNIYPEGYGLEPISLKTHQETPEEVGAALDSLKDILSPATVVTPVEEAKQEDAIVSPVVEPADIIANEPEVIEAPVVEPVEETLVEPVNPEPVAEAESPIEEVVVEPVAEEPEVTEETTSEEPVEEVVEIEPVVEVEPEPIIEPVVEEPEVSEEIPSEEPIEEVAEPVEEEIVETPIPEQPAEEIVAEVKTGIVEEKQPESEAKVEPTPVAVTAANEETKADDTPKKKSVVKIVFIVLLCIVIVAAIALLLFVFLAHIAPDFIDSLLYTEEELKIINY